MKRGFNEIIPSKMEFSVESSAEGRRRGSKAVGHCSSHVPEVGNTERAGFKRRNNLTKRTK